MSDPTLEFLSEVPIAYKCSLEVETTWMANDWVELAEIKNAVKPHPTVDAVDVTHMRSPGRAKEKKAGLADYGSVDYDLNWIPNGLTDEYIEVWRESGETRRTRLTLRPGGATRTFPSHVEDYTGEAQVGEAMTAQLTLSVDGVPIRGDENNTDS